MKTQVKGDQRRERGGLEYEDNLSEEKVSKYITLTGIQVVFKGRANYLYILKRLYVHSIINQDPCL